jgi:hypothetical protein
VRDVPDIELTRRSGSGRRLDSTELAGIWVTAVAECCVGRPYDEVLDQFKATLGQAGLVLVPESLRAVAQSISEADRWASRDIGPPRP